MIGKIKILHLEDVASDAEIVSRKLRKEHLHIEKRVVNIRKDFEYALEYFTPDVILCDHSLPSFNSLEALKIVRGKGLDIPFILVTGAVSEEFAVQIIKEGADDYILKDRLERLPSAIINSLNRYHAEKEKKELEKRFSLTINTLRDYAIFQLDTNGCVLSWNKAAESIKGFKGSEIIGKYISTFYTDEDKENGIPKRNLSIALEKGRFQTSGFRKRRDGSLFYAEVVITSLFDEHNQLKGFAKITRDITEQKMSEEKIRKSEADLLNIFNRSVDVICTTDEEGRFLKISSAAASVWGYQPEELVGRKYFDLVHPEDAEATLNIAEKIKNGLDVTMFANRFLRKDGSIVSLLWSAHWDIEERTMYSVARDATEKKKMEQVLESERQRFKELYLSSPTCICTLYGEDHAFEMANPVYLKLIGQKEILGKTLKEVFPEDGHQQFRRIVSNVYKTGNSYSQKEMSFTFKQKKNGTSSKSYLNFILQPYRNYTNEVEGIFFFGTDVTEQVKSRRKIEQSELKYRNIVETAQEGIWMIDQRNRITFVNKRLADMLEYKEAEMLGKPNTFFMENEAPELAEKGKEGKRGNIEINFVTRSGKSICASLSSSPIIDNEKYLGALGMITDITARKQAEHEKLALLKRLQVKNKDLRQFAYMVSHNLRAPIAKILGLAAIFKHSRADTELILQKIVEETSNLDNVVKDMNTIITARDSFEEAIEPINFHEELERIKRVLEDEIENSEATITCDFSTASIHTVKGKFYSIFYNLISNAIKYRSPEKRLTIHVTSSEAENHICFMVADNGIGMDLEKHKEKLFMLYKRFHIDSKIPGKGIGLNLVKAQVESLGGWIEVESEVNRGSTFKVYLPGKLQNKDIPLINDQYYYDL